MFKISGNFRWKVSFEWPEDGQPVEQAFTAVFKRLTVDELTERSQKIATSEADGSAALPEIVKFLDYVFVDFDEVEVDADRETTRQLLINDPTVAMALYMEYNAAILGRKLMEKNSEAPPE